MLFVLQYKTGHYLKKITYDKDVHPFGWILKRSSNFLIVKFSFVSIKYKNFFILKRNNYYSQSGVLDEYNPFQLLCVCYNDRYPLNICIRALMSLTPVQLLITFHKELEHHSVFNSQLISIS